uniref:Spondin-like TSP1 domain-containing protein n=1 Tax=Anabas testudineus TaxID=64144 RepID=A0A7N6BCX3_ANATE
MDQHLNRLFDSVSCLAPLITSTLHDGGLPRVLCVEGQFACRSFGCVDSAQVCDGRQDCLDGSDEEHCGTHQPPVREQGASKYRGLLLVQIEIYMSQIRFLSSPLVDCIMSPWTAWSACSVSCGLGSLFRQRDILREALPGGACGVTQFDSRACFPRACPVDGHWSGWTEWSECDAQCGGGVKQRNRTCTAPPPKNGGRECEGMTLQSQTCNSQPFNGGWSAWTPWSQCSSECDSGVQTRERFCNSPSPQHGGTGRNGAAAVEHVTLV